MGPEKFLDTQQDIIEVVTMHVEIKERDPQASDRLTWLIRGLHMSTNQVEKENNPKDYNFKNGDLKKVIS